MYMVGDPSNEHPEAAWGNDADGVLGVFHFRDELDEAETKIQGRPVFHRVPYVKMRFPGDSRTELVECLNDEHKERFPEVWRKFEAKQAGVAGGTPIQEMTVLTRGEVMMLRSVGIITVEMLANIGDSKLSMTITRDMRARAQQWLQGASATEQQLRRENAEFQQIIKNQTILIDQLQAALDAQPIEDEAEKPKRGRPRKVA